MKAPLTLLTCLAIPFTPARAQLSYQLGNTLLDIDVVVDSDRVNIPWEILWGPDNRLWMTDGPLITRWDPVTDVIDTLIDRGHGNGLGMALHPDFPTVPQIFAVFDTSEYYGGGQLCEVSRFTYDGVNDTLTDETVLLTYYHAGEHGGGRLLFDTTGNVLLTTPDYWLNGPDTLFSTNGKTLRFATDGSVPPDNPRPDHTWTWGHRNPQGLTMLPNGSIVTSEHGMAPFNNEINWIRPDRYYAWPAYDGNECINIIPDSCTSPTFTYEHPLATFGQPPSGTEFYTSDLIPELQDKLITCILWYTGLKLFTFTDELDSITGQEYLSGGAFDDMVRNRDIAIRPDGTFYLITNDRQDARIRWVHPDANTNLSLLAATTDGITLWPNPTSDRLTVSIQELGEATIALLDVQGRTVEVSPQRIGDRLLLDLQDLPAGLYAVRIADGHSIRCARVLKR